MAKAVFDASKPLLMPGDDRAQPTVWVYTVLPKHANPMKGS